MILLVVEEQSAKIVLEHIVYTLLGRAISRVSIKPSRGIDTMLTETLPNACKLLGDTYSKVIVIFDRDKMHEPYTSSKSRIQQLQEILNQHRNFPVGGFAVRENLEEFIKACLPAPRRGAFSERVNRSGKVVAARWALSQQLNQKVLKSKVTDLERSLNCQLIRDFL